MFFFFYLFFFFNAKEYLNINVGCLNGRRINQFEPILITVYPYNYNLSNTTSNFYYDFGDGSNIVTDSLVVRHVYHSSGEFTLRVVRTDTETNISSDGSIDSYAQITIYVFPHESPFMLQLLSVDEINNDSNFNNINLNMHVIEIPLGKSIWYLKMIETTNLYYNDFMSSFNANLGRYNYTPTITTENEDLLHTIHYNQQLKCYEIEFNYIGTGMQSFTIRFEFNISIGSILPLSTEYIASTKIIKFSNQIRKGISEVKDIKPIPYFPSGAVALNDKRQPIITNNNFYDWTVMNEVVNDTCVSSSRVYFLKNGILYYIELNSNETIRSISTSKKIVGIQITENDNFKLFGSPRSSFRKAETIDAPNQILLFINTTLYRITGSDEENIANNFTKIDVGKDMTNILFASAYLDSHVTVIIYEENKKFYRTKIDSLRNISDTQLLMIENLYLVFMHDFTKKMIFINDSYIFLSSDLGISLQIIYMFQDGEKVVKHASSLGYDEVVVYTSEGRLILIAPELGIATILLTFNIRETDNYPVFIYNYDDSLMIHINDLSLRIPTESLIRVLTYSLPGGDSSRLWLEKDYGTSLQFSILRHLNSGDDQSQSKLNRNDQNLHYPSGYLPFDSSQYDLSHLSLYGSTEECRFISGSKRCEILAFDNVIKQIFAGGTVWTFPSNSSRAQMQINSTYFNYKMVGVIISIPTIKLIFVVDEILSSSAVVGFISLVPDNFESITKDNPRQFDFFRVIDIRETIEYNGSNTNLVVTDTTSEGQKIVLDDINSNSQIYFNSSMVGMSLKINSEILNQEDTYFPILRVVDIDTSYVIRKKNKNHFLKEGVFNNWEITWDPNINTDDYMRRSWSLRYSWCSSISDPSFYYPIYSTRAMNSCRFDLNVSDNSLINTRVVSNEQFSVISNVSPYNVSLSFSTPKDDYSLSSFVISARDSSPQCKHTFLLGISKMCSSNIRFIINFDDLQSMRLPKLNYRAPSEHGLMIATSPYVYNVNLRVHDYNYKNKLKISQGNFNPTECSSSSKDINDMDESATNCIRSAYKVRYGIPISIKFLLQEYRIINWESMENNYSVNVKEINGRKDLCIGKKCQVNEREMSFDDTIFVTGKELYHFKFTVNVTGCLYTKYAVFWCGQEILPKAYVFLTMTIVLFLGVAIIELIYYNVVFVSALRDKTNDNAQTQKNKFD